MEITHLIDVTPENVMQETLFCAKNISSEGFRNKKAWFEQNYQNGLRIKILKNQANKQIAFIEYLPIEEAWRPIDGKNYFFIQCMYNYAKQDRNKGYGFHLIEACMQEASDKEMAGICAITSNGGWMIDERLLKKNGFNKIESKDRFELYSIKLKQSSPNPTFIDWTVQQKKYIGWHLVYADQCPWHQKSMIALTNTAIEYGINLKVTKLLTPTEAKYSPSGYGVFALLKDGKLLEDHYISETRFRNILKRELSL
jgi:hypothetical protein